MGTVNVSLPDEMIDRINDIVREMGYASRSELVRGALRSFFIEAEWMSKLTGHVLAAVTITFNMERRGVSEEVNRLQHRHENLILTTIHNHLGNTCLEVVLARGDINGIKRFAEEFKVIRGVETVKVTAASAYPE